MKLERKCLKNQIIDFRYGNEFYDIIIVREKRQDGRRYLRRALRRALSVGRQQQQQQQRGIIRPSPFRMHFPLAEMSSGHRGKRYSKVE